MQLSPHEFRAEASDVLSRWGAQVVVLQAGESAPPGWTRAYSDDDGVILVPAGT